MEVSTAELFRGPLNMKSKVDCMMFTIGVGSFSLN